MKITRAHVALAVVALLMLLIVIGRFIAPS
jgi:hypothetical protein